LVDQPVAVNCLIAVRSHTACLWVRRGVDTPILILRAGALSDATRGIKLDCIAKKC
jgi:hypothetical protein